MNSVAAKPRSARKTTLTPGGNNGGPASRNASYAAGVPLLLPCSIPSPTTGTAQPRYTTERRMRQYWFPNREVAKARDNVGLSPSCNACGIRGPYSGATSIRRFANHRRKRRCVLCPYCARPWTNGTHAVNFTPSAWISPPPSPPRSANAARHAPD